MSKMPYEPNRGMESYLRPLRQTGRGTLRAPRGGGYGGAYRLPECKPRETLGAIRGGTAKPPRQPGNRSLDAK